MVWTNKTIKSMVLCYSSVRPGTKGGFRVPPLSPLFFFPIRRLMAAPKKISGACQWCHLPLKITWHHRVVTWAPWRLRVHACLFNNLSKQITKKTSKFRDPRLVTRDSRLKSSKVTSHELRVGDSWLVTRDLGPPKSPVTSRESEWRTHQSWLVTTKVVF